MWNYFQTHNYRKHTSNIYISQKYKGLHNQVIVLATTEWPIHTIIVRARKQLKWTLESNKANKRVWHHHPSILGKSSSTIPFTTYSGPPEKLQRRALPGLVFWRVFSYLSIPFSSPPRSPGLRVPWIGPWDSRRRCKGKWNYTDMCGKSRRTLINNQQSGCSYRLTRSAPHSVPPHSPGVSAVRRWRRFLLL